MKLSRGAIKTQMQALGLTPYPAQIDLIQFLLADPGEETNPERLELPPAAHFNILMAGRYSGKSQMIALVGVILATFRPGTEILISSPSLFQTGSQTMKYLRAILGDQLRPLVSESRDSLGEGSTKRTLRLKNGSSIICVPSAESKARGFSPMLAIADEAGAWSDLEERSLRDFVGALRPRMSAEFPNTYKLLLTGTPSPRKSCYLFETVNHPPENTAVMQFSTMEIRDDVSEDQFSDLTRSEFEREIQARFVESDDCPIDLEDLTFLSMFLFTWTYFMVRVPPKNF